MCRVCGCYRGGIFFTIVIMDMCIECNRIVTGRQQNIVYNLLNNIVAYLYIVY